MLYSFLIFLPMATGLFWIAIHFLMAYRSRTFAATVVMLAFLSAYLFADACFSDPATSSSTLLVSSVLAQLVLPSILPVAGIYISRLRSDRHIHWSQFLWIVFPSVLFSAAMVILLMTGPNKIQEYIETIYTRNFDLSLRETNGPVYAYYFVTNRVLRVVIFLEVLWGIAKMLYIMHRDNLRPRHFRKFFAGGRIRVLELQFFLIILSALFPVSKSLMTRDLLFSHPWISITLSLFITIVNFFFGFFGLFGARHSVSMREIRSLFRFCFDKQLPPDAQEDLMAYLIASADGITLRHAQDRITQRLQSDSIQHHSSSDDTPDDPAANIYSAVSKNWADDGLLARFEQLIFSEHAYLEPGITLVSISEKLHSNKTYVSRLVNSTYNMPFPDLINTLRIDFAQQYLAEHRDAHQGEVAQACGFASASSFNNIFKKVTGMTPKIWLATHE